VSTPICARRCHSGSSWARAVCATAHSRSAKRRDRGVAMFVLGTKELKRYGFAAGASPSTNVPDPGFVPIARNGRFSAYAACG
jgi:hypothetical protein